MLTYLMFVLKGSERYQEGTLVEAIQAWTCRLVVLCPSSCFNVLVLSCLVLSCLCGVVFVVVFWRSSGYDTSGLVLSTQAWQRNMGNKGIVCCLVFPFVLFCVLSLPPPLVYPAFCPFLLCLRLDPLSFIFALLLSFVRCLVLLCLVLSSVILCCLCYD